MDILALIHHKFNLECIEVIGTQLVEGSGITCDDIEKFCVLSTPTQFLYFYGLEEYENPSRPLPELFLQGTQDLNARKEFWYIFEQPLEFNLPEDLGDTDETFETFVVRQKGKVVSRAWSIRRNPNAAEIAVETKEAYRGKGYGKQVVSAWATAQLQKGKRPFYGHRVGNTASEGLAKSLGLFKFAEIISYQ